MKYIEASYIKSIIDLKDEPSGLPQVLFVGRSNVGKSSFINALLNRKNLARTSNTPGKTIALNFYLIDDRYYFVDAPGYGYARRSKTQKEGFLIMLEKYLHHSEHLKFVCQLIDFKVGPTVDDLMTFNFIMSMGIPLMVVATKKDKIPKTKQSKQNKEIKTKLKLEVEYYAVSNETKENIDYVRDVIFEKLASTP
jgi:GTP-binding protein